MSRRKPGKIETDGAPLTSNPFAGLSLSDVPDAPVSPATDDGSPLPAAAASPDHPVRRLIVRRQKKGQGGKTVTCIQGLDPAGAAELLPRIRRELGCGARMDGDVLVAGTGDHSRVAAWLGRAGATNVILGN